MALAIILRNASKIQAFSCMHKIAKSTSVVTGNYFSTFHHRQNLTLSKTNNTHPITNALLNRNVGSPQIRLMSADHSRLWPLEKALSLALLGLVPAAIAAPNFVFDNLLAIASVLHFHWGLEAVVVDYVRPIIVGNALSKLALLLLYIVSATTLGGLIYYNVNDIGIGKTIRKFWALNDKEKEEK